MKSCELAMSGSGCLQISGSRTAGGAEIEETLGQGIPVPQELIVGRDAEVELGDPLTVVG